MEYKEKIKNLFLETQNLIIKDFFDYEYNQISNLEQLEKYRRKISKFETIVATTNNYNFFDNYLLEMMNKLEHKCNILENNESETALTNNNSITNIFNKIKSLFYKKTASKNKTKS